MKASRLKTYKLGLAFLMMIIPANLPAEENMRNTEGDPLEGFAPVAALQDYQILFMGNSHSSFNGLPGLVTTLIEAGSPGTTTYQAVAPGYRFLAERIGDDVTQQLLQSRTWTHVILQAQKYSTTGLYTYPTDAAETWIRRAKLQNARPVLFPEWPRRGNTEEGQRVHDLHLEISAREPACVAPVGLAWDSAIESYPGMDLHATDGNHSNLTGALLTAYVFYQVITTQPAAELPNIQGINVSPEVQQNLRELATEVVENNQSTCVEMASSVTGGIPTLDHWGLLVLGLSLAAFGAWRMK